eukprot:8153366-Pyramimonas_sp.AAC.1
MAFDMENNKKFCDHVIQQLRSQDKDYAITIDMDNRMPRERAKQEKELLTAAEHRAIRGMNGQVQWVVRLLLHTHSFEASRLAGQMSKPTVQDMKDMNSLVRSIHREGKTQTVFRGGFDLKKSVIIASHDASFDNMPNPKSQRGLYIKVGDGNMMDDHTKLYPCMLLAWSSGRIGRAVRNTLSAEAYSCSEAQD